jgi:peptide-methionine (S)-S-oxide reductase
MKNRQIPLFSFLRRGLPLAGNLFLLSLLPMSTNAQNSPDGETLVLGGGCFWCIEALYERLDGVRSVESGYAGGTAPDPTYEEVCSGRTGHAEVVRITYDPETVSLGELLDFFWQAHDPTTLNRQGADVGTQYRSIILYASEEQEAAARASMEKAQTNFRDPIVTDIEPLEAFYPAESYHQDYFDKNPNAPYCQYVIVPKLKKLEP